MQRKKFKGWIGTPFLLGFTLIVALVGCRQQQETTSTTVPGQPGMGDTGVGTFGGESMAMGETGAGGPMPLMSGGGGMLPMGMGGPPAAPSAGTQIASAEPEEILEPLEPSRHNPFDPLDRPPPPPEAPPPPPPRISKPVYVRPKPVEVEPPKPPAPPPPPPQNLRMAGLLWGENVWAILVHNNQGHVVKPGDVVNDYKVVAITRDTILLQRVDDETGKIIEVPLRGAREAVLPPGGEETAPGPAPRPGPPMPMLPGGTPMAPPLPGVEGAPGAAPALPALPGI